MTRALERTRHGLALSTAIAVGGAIALALIETPEDRAGLARTAADAVPDSGVTNPVTAVLLNFRAFDTLLEIAVLLLTLIGVWALRLRIPSREVLPPSIVFDSLLRLSAPILAVIAGYLLWIGASAPGGAFQAGAVLAGVGVLLRLAGFPTPSNHALRQLAVLGLFVFVAAALVLVVTSGSLLQYPVQYAGVLIFAIETAATVSIAVILTALFVAAEPGESGEPV